MTLTKDEALTLDYDGYIAWCWGYLHEACDRNPTTRAVFACAAGYGAHAFLEAQWAKTYWRHHVDKLRVEQP